MKRNSVFNNKFDQKEHIDAYHENDVEVGDRREDRIL